MLNIALIDDRSYWIAQVESIHCTEEFELDYFDTYAEFSKGLKCYDIIYLDYYLDKDWIRWVDVFNEVKKRSESVIWFSSVSRCNQEMLDMGAAWAVLKV